MAQITLTFPQETIQCRPADHVARQEEDGSWRVFRVDELMLVSRLVVLEFPRGPELMEDRHMSDTQQPWRWKEVHLLATGFASRFASSQEALRAITAGALGEPTPNLCLPIKEFPKDRCAVRPAPRQPETEAEGRAEES